MTIHQTMQRIGVAGQEPGVDPRKVIHNQAGMPDKSIVPAAWLIFNLHCQLYLLYNPLVYLMRVR
jgi:hypothetical protein